MNDKELLGLAQKFINKIINMDKYGNFSKEQLLVLIDKKEKALQEVFFEKIHLICFLSRIFESWMEKDLTMSDGFRNVVVMNTDVYGIINFNVPDQYMKWFKDVKKSKRRSTYRNPQEVLMILSSMEGVVDKKNKKK